MSWLPQSETMAIFFFIIPSPRARMVAIVTREHQERRKPYYHTGDFFFSPPWPLLLLLFFCCRFLLLLFYTFFFFFYIARGVGSKQNSNKPCEKNKIKMLDGNVHYVRGSCMHVVLTNERVDTEWNFSEVAQAFA